MNLLHQRLSSKLLGRELFTNKGNKLLIKQQKRVYTLSKDSYYSKYIPPTGVPQNPNDNEEPWDITNRPKRKVGQIAVRLEKMMRENDYYTIFKEPEPIKQVHPPIFIPEPRSMFIHYY